MESQIMTEIGFQRLSQHDIMGLAVRFGSGRGIRGDRIATRIGNQYLAADETMVTTPNGDLRMPRCVYYLTGAARKTMEPSISRVCRSYAMKFIDIRWPTQLKDWVAEAIDNHDHTVSMGDSLTYKKFRKGTDSIDQEVNLVLVLAMRCIRFGQPAQRNAVALALTPMGLEWVETKAEGTTWRIEGTTAINDQGIEIHSARPTNRPQVSRTRKAMENREAPIYKKEDHGGWTCYQSFMEFGVTAKASDWDRPQSRDAILVDSNFVVINRQQELRGLMDQDHINHRLGRLKEEDGSNDGGKPGQQGAAEEPNCGELVGADEPDHGVTASGLDDDEVEFQGFSDDEGTITTNNVTPNSSGGNLGDLGGPGAAGPGTVSKGRRCRRAHQTAAISGILDDKNRIKRRRKTAGHR